MTPRRVSGGEPAQDQIHVLLDEHLRSRPFLIG